MSRKYTTLVFLNPLTPGRITTSGITKSPEVTFLIVWLNLNHFVVHQLAATNLAVAVKIHLQSNQPQCVKPVGCFRRGAPSLIFDGMWLCLRMLFLSIYLTLAKWSIQYQYTVKNGFPYKNKMLITVNGAIKSVMKKDVKTNKLNF